jgi:hypothetical protein
MSRVGLNPQGSEYRSLRRQISALAACRMQLGAKLGNTVVNLDTQPIHRFDVWLSTTPDQQTLWPGTVELSAEYFASIREHAVPLDERAVAALRGSALALDIYTWLAHRLCRINRPGPVSVSWLALKDQFGQEYSDMRDFKKEFRSALRQVGIQYKPARVEEEERGLLLRQSPPPIRKVAITVR